MITDEQIEDLDTCGWEWSCIDKDEKYAFARKVIALAQSEAYDKAIGICTELGDSLMTHQMRNACMECAYEIKKLRGE